jgi:hypothetical protein
MISLVPLCLTGAVTLRGAGAASTIIDANGQHRVLRVSFDAVAEVQGITLTNGLGEINGGGIDNQGTLRLTDSVVSHCTLPSTSGGAVGGGIYNAHLLTLLRSTVTMNLATTEGGGGVYNDGFKQAVLTVSDSTISNNTIGSNGGGLADAPGGVMTITGTMTLAAPRLRRKGWSARAGGGVANVRYWEVDRDRG